MDGVVGEAGVATGQILAVALLLEGFYRVVVVQEQPSGKGECDVEFEIFPAQFVAVAVVLAVFSGAGLWIDIVVHWSVIAELYVFFTPDACCFLLSLSLLLL